MVINMEKKVITKQRNDIMIIEERLKELNINYEIVEHDAVYTVEEAKQKVPYIEGIPCKNLFLKGKKKGYFLYTLPEDKQVNLKELAKFLHVQSFHFASHDDLKNILKLIPGSVTPLGIINDTENKVIVVLDKELTKNKVLVHPNRNTATISIKYDDLIKFIKCLNHELIEV